MIEKVIESQNTGLNMGISNGHIYVRNGKYLFKYDLSTFTEIIKAQIFRKDGKARSFYFCNNRIYLRDFCDLYEINCDTLEIIRTWKLGENLSSDICAIIGNNYKVYACIRGGKITVIDLKNNNLKQYSIINSSMWNIVIHNSNVYVSCVNGELIELDKDNMSIIRKNQIHKKNIYSLFIHKDILYTVSQDTFLKATDITHFETIFAIKKAVSNMSTILGIYENKMVTSNPNQNEITIWNTEDLSIVEKIKFPTGGLNSNGIIMKNNCIYGSNQDGVYRLDIKKSNHDNGYGQPPKI
jgi:outer membrane protein assembly factor BamB